MKAEDAPVSGLSLLHTRLEAHFDLLRSNRDAQTGGSPVFALEHGLSEGELALLRAEVCAAAQRGDLRRQEWLPFVVYAAEIGYEYCGDEYWQTFEARTPRWADLGDPGRQYIRSRFTQFKERFGGAQPTGPWARHFSIICWPITHAVLPTDLQRHLARLLFEYRRSLTAEALLDPVDLGRRLAARAWHASSRFQNFAQNTSLLGQVAAALLTGDDEESPYLLQSTLARIADDLSKKREARRWLEDAKFTARRVRTRGFRAPERPSGKDSSQKGRTFVASTDPTLLVREGPKGWAVFVELPDLAGLAERLPMMRDELAQLRPRIEGVNRRFAMGHLVHPGQQVRVDQWPDRRRPLVQLENGSAAVNAMLADQCLLSPGPRWLFRIRERALGSEIRGKFVRPGHHYLLLSEVEPTKRPVWARPVVAATADVHALWLDPPDQLGPEDLAALEELGIGSVSDVEVRPVGFVPAAWDGEGTAEWLEGEAPLIAISTTSAVAQCIFMLDGEPHLVPWPDGASEVFVRLHDLVCGTHQLNVSLLPADADAPVAEGSLDVLIRPAHTRPPSGTPREALMILASPASPNLDELWDGQAALQILGGRDRRSRLTLALADRLMRPLVTKQMTVTLPIDQTRWAELFSRQFRRVDDVHRSYEQAESCVVTVASAELGSVSLRCERAFAPLRWAFDRDRDGPLLKLIDNTDGVPVGVRRYEFTRPAEGVVESVTPRSAVRWPVGGLFVASAGSTRAAVVLPAHVRDFADLRAAAPVLPRWTRSIADVQRAIDLSHLWGTASLPADPFAAVRRLEVLRAIASEIAGLVGGPRWAKGEWDHVRSAVGAVDSLAELIGDAPYQRSLAAALRDAFPALQVLEAPKRAAEFSSLLSQYARPAGVTFEDHRLGEFLLKLASSPASLVGWPAEELRTYLNLTLSSPVLLRAARFVVIATATEDEDAGSTYSGWIWE